MIPPLSLTELNKEHKYNFLGQKMQTYFRKPLDHTPIIAQTLFSIVAFSKLRFAKILFRPKFKKCAKMEEEV